MLQTLGEEEARSAVADDRVEIRCEFCGQGYRFTEAEITGLFAPVAAPPTPAPERLQ